MAMAPQTVVETQAFIASAKGVLADDERAETVDFIARNPRAGVLLAGGIRKVRIAREGSGKRGGYRVVFFFGGGELPVFLLAAFAKNEKANLSKGELADLVRFCKENILKRR
jgi:hypothetical protein